MYLLKLVPDNTNIDFMRWRNLALVLSIIATIASLVLVGVRGLNLGVDFVGGQMIRTTFSQPVDVEQLRGRVGGARARRSEHPGIRRADGPIRSACPGPKAARRRPTARRARCARC